MSMETVTRRARLWPWPVGIIVVAIALICVIVVASKTPQSGGQPGVSSEESSALGLTTSPSVPAPSATSSAAPEPPSLPQDFVAQAMPTSFGIVCGNETVIAQQGLTKTFRNPIGKKTEIIDNRKVVTTSHILDILGDTIALVRDDEVPGDNQVPWASLPGSEADTVSIWGHANDNPRMVFNPIAEFTGDPSSCRATIELPGGELGFRHIGSHMITPKGAEFEWSKAMSERSEQERKGKLLVVTCFDNDTEIAWEFELEYSQAA